MRFASLHLRSIVVLHYVGSPTLRKDVYLSFHTGLTGRFSDILLGIPSTDLTHWGQSCKTSLLCTNESSLFDA